MSVQRQRKLAEQLVFMRDLRSARRKLKRPKTCTTPGFFKVRNVLKRARHERRKCRRPDLEQERLVILDIDHTLVHCMLADDIPEDAPPPDHFLVVSGVAEPVCCFKRPGLDAFLSSLATMPAELRVGVWTAGGRDYATQVLNAIWPGWRARCLFLAAQPECTWISRRSCVKELGLLPDSSGGGGGRPYNVLLVDDNPDTARLNAAKGYAVWQISPFEAGLLPLMRAEGITDHELARVDGYLKHVLQYGARFEKHPQRVAAKVRAQAQALYSSERWRAFWAAFLEWRGAQGRPTDCARGDVDEQELDEFIASTRS